MNTLACGFPEAGDYAALVTLLLDEADTLDTTTDRETAAHSAAFR
jgi:hypothetical protein